MHDFDERNRALQEILRKAASTTLPDLSLDRQEHFGKVAVAELFRLSSMAKYLDELPMAPKLSAKTRTAQMFGDVQNIISIYNQPAIWREIVNTFSEIRYLLAESRAYREQEASCPDLLDSLSLHLHRRKMQSFDWAIVKLCTMLCASLSVRSLSDGKRISVSAMPASAARRYAISGIPNMPASSTFENDRSMASSYPTLR
jgi:hypothetical protein